MPRPKTHEFWEKRIFALKAQEPHLSAEAMARRFGQEQAGMGYWPAPRTIRRILEDEWTKLTPEERRQYAYFRWPESMGIAPLPWEAASAGIELMRERAGHPRPTVRLVKWYWRVTQIAPDASAFERRHAAGFLLLGELLDRGQGAIFRHVEGWAAYTPWRSEESRRHFDEALERGDIPKLELQIPPGIDKDGFLEALATIMGVRLANAEALMGLIDARYKVSLDRKSREEADNDQEG